MMRMTVLLMAIFAVTNAPCEESDKGKFPVDELRPAEISSIHIKHEYRTWTRRRDMADCWGRLVAHTLDMSTVWIQCRSGGSVRIGSKYLVTTDRVYLSSLVATAERSGWVWIDNGYCKSKEDIKAFHSREKAKALIRENDSWVSLIKRIEIYRAADSEPWAFVLENYRSYSGFRRTGQVVCYLPEKGKIMADGDIFKGRYFWAGTCTAKDEDGETRTRHVLADNPQLAIERVLAEQFKDPDEKNHSEDANGERLTKTKGKLVGSGSGFFVTRSGYIVTNSHVIDGGGEFKIVTANGTLNARLIKCDPATDLALLKVDGTFAACKLSRRRIEKLGSEIFTLGFPQPGLQGFSPKVTKGVVSGTDGFMGDIRLYQIDASIQPGNSGGPLLDNNGCVVGVIVASLKNSQAVNYAIKKSYLQAFLDNAGGCADEVEETDDTKTIPLTAVIDNIRPSCVLVLTYE